MSAFVPPPRLAEALMEGALHTQVQRDGIVGDLREEFARRLESRGRLRCELWYWKQAVRVYLRFRMEGRRTGSGTRSRENSSLGQGTPGRGGQTPPLPGPGALQDLGQDLRIALRGLVRSPAFTFIAVLSLAVGISANTALFSLLHATWLTPVPGVSGEGTVVEVLVREGGPEHQEWTFPDFRSVKESSAPMEAWAGWKRRDGTLTTEDGAQRVGVVYASAEYFRVLGVSISRGRGFLPEEDRGVGQRRVAVVSHRLWETRLGGRPDVLGSTVTLNRAPYTVVGVAPEEFHGHRVLEEPPDLWVPLVQHPYLAGEESLASDRTVQWLLVLARLEPGTELEEANAALGTVFDRLAEEYPETNENRSATAYAFGPVPALGRSAAILGVSLLVALGGVVLLIICGNVAGMILARNATRDQEIAVRMALGSGRGRLIRFWMMEALLLALVGGGAGVWLAYAAPGAIARVLDTPVPPGTFPLSGPVLFFSVGVTSLAALAFGLFPAVRFSGGELLSSIKDDTGGGGRRVGRIHRVTASAQTGLAFLFVVVAVLFVRATGVMEERELGFSPDPLLVTQLDLSREGYASSEEGRLFVTRLAEAVGSVPGVASATVADGLPLDLIGNYTAVRRADMADEPGGRVRVEFTRATEGYFETIGTPILQGRGIEATDDESSEPVVVVTQSLASRLWPGETALGRRVSIPLGLDSARTYTVAGVVAHTASSRAREDWPHVFFALRQTYRPRIMIIARAAGDPAALVEPVRSAILGVDPGLPHPGFILGSGLVERALQPQRNTISLAGAFGVLALLLSAIGVYGVVSFSVVSRTREIGLRMAMGASKSRVLAEVFRDAVKLAIPGLMVGAVLGAAMAASMGRFLLGISPVDPLSMLTSAGVLFAVVVLASLVPARRASSIQPMRALGRE